MLSRDSFKVHLIYVTVLKGLVDTGLQLKTLATSWRYWSFTILISIFESYSCHLHFSWSHLIVQLVLTCLCYSFWFIQHYVQL